MRCNHLGLIFKVLIRNNAVGRGEFCDKIGLDFGAGAPSLTGSSTEPGCPNALGLEEGEEEEEEGGSIGLPLLSRPELHVGDPLPQPIFGLAVRQTLSLQGLLLGVWGPLGWGLFSVENVRLSLAYVVFTGAAGEEQGWQWSLLSP